MGNLKTDLFNIIISRPLSSSAWNGRLSFFASTSRTAVGTSPLFNRGFRALLTKRSLSLPAQGGGQLSILLRKFTKAILRYPIVPTVSSQISNGL